MRKTVCLEYHLGQCTGPCEGKISKKEYNDVVDQLKKFLEGRKDDLVRALEGRMKKFSKMRKYEKALIVKKRIEALTAIQQLHDRSQHPMYGELDELQNALDLKALPIRIECFDISDIGGRQAVGSMVTFVAGKPYKNGYRRFKIRTVKGADDYSMIGEVIRRRYSRLKKEGKKMPDLVLIDGGKGHLSVARTELQDIGLEDLPLASIAKEFNHLYVESRAYPIRLSPGSRLLLLIQRVRDEAHRFAVTYHRRLRNRKNFMTELRDIEGIGPLKEKALLEKFGNVKNVKKATRQELTSAGIGEKTARAVWEYFRGKK